ncbi:uncharacterized protein LOC133923883 [Phragmites australis]|uniref:uncharacterized protein LOC133923883 n=1 Tax=Phragmites australis TaxID=29695 RepID=UPI002D777486|nr:uncharacterized protein LOC133923883 [Phragmites australis]
MSGPRTSSADLSTKRPPAHSSLTALLFSRYCKCEMPYNPDDFMISQADFELMKQTQENSELLSKVVQSPEKLQIIFGIKLLLVLKLQRQSCKHYSQHPIMRCKHFKIGGDKKGKGTSLF